MMNLDVAQRIQRAAQPHTPVKIVEPKAEHTPGPWKAVMNARTASVITDMSDGTYGQAIAICQQVQKPFVMANAKLIACAPEMAEMLHDIQQNLDVDSKGYANVTALLKKAGIL